MKTVIGLFERARDAEGAIDQLRSRGFQAEDISIITEDKVMRRHLEGRVGSVVSPLTKCVRFGTVIGAVIGAIVTILIGMGVLIVPPIEPVFVTGSLLDIITALLTVLGLITFLGFIIGILVGVRLPARAPRYYAEGLTDKGALVIVETKDIRAVEALYILRQASYIEYDLRLAEWRNFQWSKLDQPGSEGSYPRLTDKTAIQK